MSDSLWPHELLHSRLPCPWLAPRVCSNSCPLNPWCHYTISFSVVSFLLLSSMFPSIRVFSSESAFRIRWLKYWSFRFSISPSNEYSGLISFRIDWFDLLAIQETLKSLLQHHNLKASIFCHSALFMVQLSHLYMTTEKTKALTIWTFVSKVMSLLFNMLSGFVIALKWIEIWWSKLVKDNDQIQVAALHILLVLFFSLCLMFCNKYCEILDCLYGLVFLTVVPKIRKK